MVAQDLCGGGARSRLAAAWGTPVHTERAVERGGHEYRFWYHKS